ncbi:PTS transporter subunit EIIC, partial [Rhodovulum adriaticum]|uniref:PTS transporter subunit EIIC n=1 Tax=Rhodovulum adriaticum TaxID=35804 RepID=UPI001908B586
PGMYQAGWFPIMMFGLPAAAIAMYNQAKPERKSFAKSMLLAGALATFATGVTEPIEFAFMFLAPGLYAIHAGLTAISVWFSAQMGWYAGFGFSAGLVDMFLSSNNPMAENWYMLIPQGLVFALVYYLLFTFVIKRFNLKTPGREDVVEGETEGFKSDLSDRQLAENILDRLGGASNIEDHTYCTTRLRLRVKDNSIVDEDAIRGLG